MDTCESQVWKRINTFLLFSEINNAYSIKRNPLDCGIVMIEIRTGYSRIYRIKTNKNIIWKYINTAAQAGE